MAGSRLWLGRLRVALRSPTPPAPNRVRILATAAWSRVPPPAPPKTPLMQAPDPARLRQRSRPRQPTDCRAVWRSSPVPWATESATRPTGSDGRAALTPSCAAGTPPPRPDRSRSCSGQSRGAGGTLHGLASSRRLPPGAGPRRYGAEAECHLVGRRRPLGRLSTVTVPPTADRPRPRIVSRSVWRQGAPWAAEVIWTSTGRRRRTFAEPLVRD